MAKGKRKDLFWLSYSDLMTSMFFIMLVLFIVCIAKLSADNTKAIKKIHSLESILELENQFKNLTASSCLRYDSIHKTFIAKDLEGIEIFEAESDVIKTNYLGIVYQVGNSLDSVLRILHSKNPDFSYLLVIEGYSANSGKWDKDREYNYDLSFRRALCLYNTWRKAKHDLRKYNTEILICGSGLNGVNRDPIEDNNKRFVIQIIPKVSKPRNM